MNNTRKNLISCVNDAFDDIFDDVVYVEKLLMSKDGDEYINSREDIQYELNALKRKLEEL